MSMIWLEPFIYDPTDSNVFTFQSVNLVIYLNMISIICFVVYSMLYKMDYTMQKAPNSLIIWKMFGECLLSVHILILFLCFSIENNKKKLILTKYIMWLSSLLSPIGLFLTYFFSACIAQNLYCTFHNYKNDFDYRMQKYKIYASAIGFLVLLSSLIFNEHNENNTGKKFSIEYYPNWYIGLFYSIGIFFFLFIIVKMFFVMKKKSSFLSFINQSSEHDEFRTNIVSLFISRHLMFCLIFLICFVPNNLIILWQIFHPQKLCNDCRVYTFTLYGISLSGTCDFIIKMTEPYMKKYFHVFYMLFTKKKTIPATEDYSSLYNSTHRNLLDNPLNINDNKNYIEMDNFDDDEIKLNSMVDTVEIVTREMQTNDFYKSLVSIYLTTIEEKIYDKDEELRKYESKYLPWDDNIYQEKTKLIHYTDKNISNSFSPNNDKNFYLNVKIRKYAPKIFYELRKIDNISNEDYLKSLNPQDNLKIIKESFASGGRSSNPIIFTYDKKLLLKTISKSEKDILIKILPEFHRRMRDCHSLLCRIYGIYRIEIVGKQGIHIIVMRNMNELPNESKIVCFDLKGSTVERTSLSKNDTQQILKGYGMEIVNLYKKKILKDLDFDLLPFNFDFSKEECDLLQNSISEDSEFLKGNNLIDYSMLVSIHEYNEQDYEKVDNHQRYRILVSANKKYLYNLSIIDFLTPYGLTKKFELGFKTAGAMVGDKKDTNFSVLDAVGYSRRFIRYLNKKFHPKK